MLKEKCDNCGSIEDCPYEFFYDRESMTEAIRLKFCYDCGEKIEKILEEGVN